VSQPANSIASFSAGELAAGAQVAAPHPVPSLDVAVVGATGAVGAEFLALVAERALPVRRLRLLASARSAGRLIDVPSIGTCTVEPLSDESLAGADVVFLCAGSDISRACAPAAIAAGAWVIDNSSAFRADPAAILMLPEVNGAALNAAVRDRTGPRIVAVPNCSTIIALLAVSPLRALAPVSRMVVSTYQAVSGAGAAAMAELEQQARDWSAGKPLSSPVFGRPALFNVFSHNSAIGADGSNAEERKLQVETQRLWSDPSVRIAATCVRVPVLRAHCESIAVEFGAPVASSHEDTERRVREVLACAPGIEIVDDRSANAFPEPRHAAGRDPVLVGRIRADRSLDPGRGVLLFVAGDQLRVGAALAGIRIAERLAQAGAFAASSRREQRA
jgi:aspartate-semialdehyde dehydrogenase